MLTKYLASDGYVTLCLLRPRPISLINEFRRRKKRYAHIQKSADEKRHERCSIISVWTILLIIAELYVVITIKVIMTV